MKVLMNTKALLNQLQAISSAVPAKSTMDVLLNVLISASAGQLTLTGTNLSLQLVASHPENIEEPGAVTVPMKKLLDICKNLPAVSGIELSTKDGKLLVKSGRSRYTLATLPASDYPNVERTETPLEVRIPQAQLLRLLKKTSHAMASQDVRYYLNGTLLRLHNGNLIAVATDGHRLAKCSASIGAQGSALSILPIATTFALTGLLTTNTAEITVRLGATHIVVDLPFGEGGSLTVFSNLVDGKYPDYTRVIPEASPAPILLQRDEFAQAITRTILVSTAKFRAGRLMASPDLIRLQCVTNNETDEALDEVTVEYNGRSIEVGYNFDYFVEALKCIDGAQALLHITSPTTGAMLTDPQDATAAFVIMPCKI